jgi:hypothetical protein
VSRPPESGVRPARLFRPPNRLEKILNAAERRAFAEHVARAEREMAALLPTLRARLPGQVEALVDLCHEPEADVFAASPEIGFQALAVAEAARAVGLEGVARVAGEIWALVEALLDRGVWHTEALTVQAEALQMSMANAPLPPAEQAVIDERLKALRDAVGF